MDSSMYSRREVLAGLSRALLAITLGTLFPSLAKAQPKVDKKTAKYQSSPKNGQQCSGCAYFQPTKSCKLVEGDISPTGWCMLFAPKR